MTLIDAGFPSKEPCFCSSVLLKQPKRVITNICAVVLVLFMKKEVKEVTGSHDMLR